MSSSSTNGTFIIIMLIVCFICFSIYVAHPNLKLFITHGGLLGGTEAVYHGVPVLVIPVFADQLTNAQNAEEGGYALSLPYSSPEFSQPKLESMIRDLLDNDRYVYL